MMVHMVPLGCTNKAACGVKLVSVCSKASKNYSGLNTLKWYFSKIILNMQLSGF